MKTKPAMEGGECRRKKYGGLIRWARDRVCYFILTSAFCLRMTGQTYSMDWSKVAGGGGTSTNGPVTGTNYYSVSGTIGQPDACVRLDGGNYSLTGGFWSLISVVQTAGAPTLYIAYSGNTVTVYWQEVAGWRLVQSGELATAGTSWTASSPPTLTNGTNYLTLASPTDKQFYRLKQ